MTQALQLSSTGRSPRLRFAHPRIRAGEFQRWGALI